MYNSFPDLGNRTEYGNRSVKKDLARSPRGDFAKLIEVGAEIENSDGRMYLAFMFSVCVAVTFIYH